MMQEFLNHDKYTFVFSRTIVGIPSVIRHYADDHSVSITTYN